MAIDFPASPTLNQTFTSGNVNYVWDGTKWTAAVSGGIALDQITEGNTKAEVIDTGSDGRFVVTTEGSERARVDSSGRLLLGTSSARANFYGSGTNGANILNEGTTYQTSTIASINNANDSVSGYLVLGKSRGTSVGSSTIVSANDNLGVIDFLGADGTRLLQAARISAEVDGTPGANDMPGRLVFSTTADGASSPTERMRVGSDGTLYVGQTTRPTTATVAIRVGTSNASGVVAQLASDTGTSYPWSNYNAAGNYVGGISCTSTATSFPTSSDYRLKTNIQPLTGAIDIVSQLKPSTFEFHENPGETVQGFIAHELQEVVPLAVVGEKDAEDSNGRPIYQGVDAAKLVPCLTAALQEAIGEIESLKARVAALESA